MRGCSGDQLIASRAAIWLRRARACDLSNGIDALVVLLNGLKRGAHIPILWILPRWAPSLRVVAAWAHEGILSYSQQIFAS
jgi:hypothetical protein